MGTDLAKFDKVLHKVVPHLNSKRDKSRTNNTNSARGHKQGQT